MSDSTVLVKTCVAVTQNHGVTVEERSGTLAFRTGDDPAVFLPADEFYAKSVVRKLQRVFNIPIFCFYNSAECKPGCKKGGDPKS